MTQVRVIGAGLAGCEAAWQLAQQGIAVELLEMKPIRKTPAHDSASFCELCCSNSLRSDQLENAVGLLKEEMRRFSSLVIGCADETRVPAGGALAVAREEFSDLVTRRIRSHPLITVHCEEVTAIPTDLPVIVATGPLSTDTIAQDIQRYADYSLSFYDAAAPIVTLDSVDQSVAYLASRYHRGTPDYWNCPMDEDQYNTFYDALVTAEEAPVRGFEHGNVFEGCMPVEEMAKRGRQSLLFGPLKPVGLPDPRTGREPYAVVQLRRDNRAGTLYNLVGFQTHLKFLEQKRVFSLIPGLEQAEFVRYGVMHRNTFLRSPGLLNEDYSLKLNPAIVFAGQMTGVEGYVESAASGLVAGVQLGRRLRGKEPLAFSAVTALGALAQYVSHGAVGDFQPMNINFGIIEPLNYRVKGKRNKNAELARRSLAVVDILAAAHQEEEQS